MPLKIAVISLVTIISFLCGYGFAKSGNDEVRRELIGIDSELAYRIHHACGRGYEMYDWSVSADTVFIDCSSRISNGGGFHSTKTVVVER